MPDDQPMTSHVSLRVPNDVVEAFDRIAAALEWPRSWVMLRALRGSNPSFSLLAGRKFNVIKALS